MAPCNVNTNTMNQSKKSNSDLESLGDMLDTQPVLERKLESVKNSSDKSNLGPILLPEGDDLTVYRHDLLEESR